MPILPRETEIAPEEIFDLGSERPWGVAHVRSRQEKSLARHLLRHGIPFYVPTVDHRVRRAARMSTSHVPLFPGYVFHRATTDERSLLWRSNVVANLLDVPDQIAFGDELGQIRRLQLAGASLKPFQELLPGQP